MLISGLDAASLGFGVASTQRFKGLGWPRRQRSFNLVNLGGLKRVCRVGAQREGVETNIVSSLGFGCPREFWSSERAEGGAAVV